MSILDQIINSASLSKMFEYYGIEKQRNGAYLCPFHNDTNPSLTITEDDRHFECWSCHEKGNIDNFVEKMERQRGNSELADNYLKRYDFIIKEQNLSIPFSLAESKPKQLSPIEQKRLHYKNIMKDAKDIAKSELLNDKYHNGVATKYLKKRGISEDTAKHFEIGYNSNYTLQEKLSKKYDKEELFNVGILAKAEEKYYDFQYNRLLIPIKDASGDVVAFGGRSLEENPKMKYKNTKVTEIFKKSEILFNYNQANHYAKSNKELIILEGYFDVISAWEMGLKNSVALMGVELTEEHMQMLEELKKDEIEITLCLDNDAAGRKAMNKIIPELLKRNFEVNVIDTKHLNNGKDMNDLLLSGLTVETLNKVKISGMSFLFEYAFDEYENMKKDISIYTVKKVYDRIFAEEKFDNNINLIRFVEFVHKRYHYTKQEIKAVCKPEKNNTIVSKAMENVFCVFIKSQIEKYAQKHNDNILQTFLAQGGLTKKHILEGLNNNTYIDNTKGTSVNYVAYINEYLKKQPEYIKHKELYNSDLDKAINTVYAVDKSGEMVRVSLNSNQKYQILQKIYSKYTKEDLEPYLELINRIYIADNLKEVDGMLKGDFEYNELLEFQKEISEDGVALLSYGGMYLYTDKEKYEDEYPSKYTVKTKDGVQYILVPVFFNKDNILNLKPENYLIKTQETEPTPQAIHNTIRENMPPMKRDNVNIYGRTDENRQERRLIHQQYPTQPED